MAESALPFPTPTRTAFAGQVHAGRIRWYNFVTPVAFHTVTGRKHTRDLDELVASHLASVPSCPEGESRIAELTDAGRKHFKISTEGEGPGSTSPEPAVADKGIRVTAVDLETGETAVRTIQPGNYVLVVAAPCYVSSEQHHGTGTTQITLKGRDRSLNGTAWVAPTGEVRSA